MEILVDSNVILDIATEDKEWFQWSSETLAFYGDSNNLLINPIIYAEVSVGFKRVEEVDAVLPLTHFFVLHYPTKRDFSQENVFCGIAGREANGDRHSRTSSLAPTPL